MVSPIMSISYPSQICSYISHEYVPLLLTTNAHILLPFSPKSYLYLTLFHLLERKVFVGNIVTFKRREIDLYIFPFPFCLFCFERLGRNSFKLGKRGKQRRTFCMVRALIYFSTIFYVYPSRCSQKSRSLSLPSLFLWDM